MIDKLLGALIGPILTESRFLKKAPYCALLWDGTRWTNRNPAGSSARRCKKARKVLIGLGYELAHIKIVAKGFDLPAPGGG